MVLGRMPWRMHHHSTTHVPLPYLFWLPCVSHSIAHGVARASRCRFSLFLLHAKVTSYWELTRALLVLSAIAITEKSVQKHKATDVSRQFDSLTSYFPLVQFP